MTKKIEPNTFEMPNEAKMAKKFGLVSLWVMAPMSLVTLAVTIYSLIIGGLTTTTLVMGALCLVLAGLTVLAFIHYKNHAIYKFETPKYKIKLEFDSPKYYVPPEVFEQTIVEPNLEAFKPFHGHGDLEMTKDITFKVQDDKPTHWAVPEAYGMTWPAQGLSKVWGPMVLSNGLSGHELRLHFCHRLYPGRSEKEDLDWMKDVGII